MPTYSTYSSLGYIENLYVKFSYPHTRNEECSYWEWPGLSDERTFFLSTWMCASRWKTVDHSVTLIHIAHMMVIIHHNLQLYGFSNLITKTTSHWGIVNIHQHAYVSLVPPQYSHQVSSGSYANVSAFHFCCLSVLGLVACLSCSARQCHNSKSVYLPSHQVIQGKKRNCPCIICAHILLSSSLVLSLSHGLLSHAVLCTVCPSQVYPNVICVSIWVTKFENFDAEMHFFGMCCWKITLPLKETVTSSIARFSEGL